ncbi:MAG: CapA family protein [Bacteroidales bacterium]|nr:CapA family protein [Bacteroidales bacterium]
MNKNWFFISFYFLFFLTSHAQQEAEKTIKLLFLGDIMGHGPQIKTAYNLLTKTYDYDPNYKFVKTILSDADFTLGNLEVTLGTKPYTGYPTFSSPPELALAAKKAGIDVLVTSNNHSCDKRKKGVEKTIAILDSLQIAHTGTFVNQKVKDSLNPLILYKNDIKIALLNYTYGTNGIPVTPPNIVNLLNKKTILKDIAQAKKLNPDQIIAFVHWGHQYKDLPNQEQKNWFQFFNDNGVSIVIGSHPHVVQPMEWNKSENNLVVYSLGNFVSNQRTFPRDGGTLFELTLSKQKGKTTIADAKYQLTWVYKQEIATYTEYYILPIDEFEYKAHFFHNKNDYKKMMRFAKHARNLLDKHNLNIPEQKTFTNGMFQLMRELYLNI